MKIDRYEHRHLNVVCDLGASDAAVQGEEWRRIKAQSLDMEVIARGVRLWLPETMIDEVRDLASRESKCCGFLDIEVAVRDGRVRLEVTSAAEGGAPVIELLRDS